LKKGKIIYLRNMVSKSCIKLIDLYFSKIDDIHIIQINLGRVVLDFNSVTIDPGAIRNHFESIGFDEVVNENEILVEKIKAAVIELICFTNNANSLLRNSDYISEKVQEPYTKISKTFSLETGTTLERYVIQLKIERAKQLILENEYSLSEVAYMLGYSSVQYLSGQFKKITGHTVSQFIHSKESKRVLLTELTN